MGGLQPDGPRLPAQGEAVRRGSCRRAQRGDQLRSLPRIEAPVLGCLTGDIFFPGGLGAFTAHAYEYLEFESGPTETVQLQWATYYDAADEAGISRLWGGIHPRADDFPGRIMGSVIGKKACAEAQKYYGNGKVALCHVAPGNLGDAHTISVAPSALRAHLAHGDSIGACDDVTF